MTDNRRYVKSEREPLVTVSFNVPKAEIERLQAISTLEGISVTTALREAIALQVFVAERQKEGVHFLMEWPSGQVREMVFSAR